MTATPLVSIICAAWNAERTIGEAIASVLAQQHMNWELLIGDDGSTDGTVEVVRGVNDPRIRLVQLPHMGVGAARNALLERMQGEYFCFLDADDVLPPPSIAARVALLIAGEGAAFADGAVEMRSGDLSQVIDRWRPAATGDPLPHLLVLDGKCFLGNTWLVRRDALRGARFEPGLTHGEDLLFCLELLDGRRYVHTPETVLWYRRGAGGAMSDLRGLENGYATLYQRLCTAHLLTPSARCRFKRRIARIMILSHLKNGRAPFAAARVLVRYAFLRSSKPNTPR